MKKKDNNGNRKKHAGRAVVSRFDETNKPHDLYFKNALKENPLLARQFLEVHLDKKLIEKINLNKMEFYPTNSITAVGGELIGDVAIKTEIDGVVGFILISIEHQSRNDPLMALRKLEYLVYTIVQYVREQIENKTPESEVKIPLVVQILAYHGESPCTMSNDIRDYVDAPRELVDDYFLRPFKVIDFTQMPDDELKRQNLAGLFGASLKYSLASAKNAPNFVDILDYFAERFNSIGAQEHFMLYVFDYVINASRLGDNLSHDDIIKVSEKISEKVKEDVMTLAEKLRNEGRHEGRHTGEIDVLRRQLLKKFGDIGDERRSILANLGEDEIFVISERILDAKSLDELFPKK